MVAAEDLTLAWLRRWPGCRPLGSTLRVCVPERWVRFHFLPGSKRLPETPAEWGEVLNRYHTVLADVAATTAAAQRPLTVITAGWSSTEVPAVRDSALTNALSDARPWTTFRDDDDDDDDSENWTHLFVSQVDDARSLDPLLRLVAADAAAEVIVTTADLDWLFAPYDGGMDVITASAADRDVLRGRHPDWLSTHPQGL